MIYLYSRLIYGYYSYTAPFAPFVYAYPLPPRCYRTGHTFLRLILVGWLIVPGWLLRLRPGRVDLTRDRLPRWPYVVVVVVVRCPVADL